MSRSRVSVLLQLTSLIIRGGFHFSVIICAINVSLVIVWPSGIIQMTAIKKGNTDISGLIGD